MLADVSFFDAATG